MPFTQETAAYLAGYIFQDTEYYTVWETANLSGDPDDHMLFMIYPESLFGCGIDYLDEYLAVTCITPYTDMKIFQ